MVKLELEMAGKKFKSEGNTMLEALENIDMGWDRVKTKGVFTFSKGKNKGQKLLYLKQLRILFANKTRRAGWARQFEKLLEANVCLNESPQ